MKDLCYFDVLRCDKSTAGAGLEVRVPFLDKEVIHNAWSNNHKLLEDKGDLKRTLKDVLAQEVFTCLSVCSLV